MGPHEEPIIDWHRCTYRAGTTELLFLSNLSRQLSAISSDTIEILTNLDILAINQDPVYGESITPFRWGINVTYFLLPLASVN